MMRQKCELSTCNDALGLEYNLQLHITRPKRCRFSLLQSALITAIGVFIGFLLCDLFRHALRHHCQTVCCDQSASATFCCDQSASDYTFCCDQSERSTLQPPFLSKFRDGEEWKNLIYVGVMTAEKYLNTRARAVHNSWATTIPGRVEFFTSSKSKTNLPVVNLPGVDDTVYPPQKKSFMMLKYMHDYYINDYEWFMRADDDVFIHGDRLAAFLHSLNSSRKLYLGQAGQGVDAEHGLLGLDPHDNYCMGGTTMIFSRATLRRMVPQINFCIKHLVSTHEDVEIGRCVRKFAGTSCPWAFEFRNLFYQNHDEANGSFTKPGLLRKLHKPITMHPVKDSSHLHRMQAHFLDQKLRDIRYKNLLMSRDIKSMSKIIDPPIKQAIGFPADLVLDKIHPKIASDVLPWVFFDKSYYSPWERNQKHKIPAPLFQGIQDVVMETMRLINSRARELGRHIDYRGLLYGYHRLDPVHSAEYVTDLLLNYHKHRGRQLKVPVRRHSYIQQPFTLPEIRLHDVIQDIVHFIVPVLGRGETLMRFLKNYETVCLRDSVLKTRLILVDFNDESSDSDRHLRSRVAYLNSVYDDHIEILRVREEFSRAKALQEGALHSPDHALLFFIDLDLEFNSEVLLRVQMNTIAGQSAYFPIVFSQYDPEIVCRMSRCSDNDFRLSGSRGYWRHFGFGIAAIFREDFFRVGGFNLSIRGWGKEDVDFYTKCLSSNLTIFRGPDPGLVHIFHKINCPETLSKQQLRMCEGTMRSNLAPSDLMSRLIYNNLSSYDKN